MALTTADESSPSGIDYARYFLYNDPTWPWQALDYSTTQPADKLDPDNATANNFDLTPFHARGGKLIHHHGLADGSIATGSGIHFYNQVPRLLKPKGVDLAPSTTSSSSLACSTAAACTTRRGSSRAPGSRSEQECWDRSDRLGSDRLPRHRVSAACLGMWIRTTTRRWRW